MGVAAATIGTMRQAGMSMSMGLATLVLALEVGRHEIVPADYPRLLTSIRLSFLIFTALCVARCRGLTGGAGGCKRQAPPSNGCEPRRRTDVAGLAVARGRYFVISSSTSLATWYFLRSLGLSILPVALRGTWSKMTRRGRL